MASIRGSTPLSTLKLSAFPLSHGVPTIDPGRLRLSPTIICGMQGASVEMMAPVPRRAASTGCGRIPRCRLDLCAARAERSRRRRYSAESIEARVPPPPWLPVRSEPGRVKIEAIDGSPAAAWSLPTNVYSISCSLCVTLRATVTADHSSPTLGYTALDVSPIAWRADVTAITPADRLKNVAS
jgi:hypothetical protein